MYLSRNAIMESQNNIFNKMPYIQSVVLFKQNFTKKEHEKKKIIYRLLFAQFAPNFYNQLNIENHFAIEMNNDNSIFSQATIH